VKFLTYSYCYRNVNVYSSNELPIAAAPTDSDILVQEFIIVHKYDGPEKIDILLVYAFKGRDFKKNHASSCPH